MTRALEQWTPVVSVNGADLPADAEIISIKVERGVRLIGRITLRIADNGFAETEGARYTLGNEIKVTTFSGDLLMIGTITSTQLTMTSNRSPVLTVTADDAAAKLTRGTRVTTYADVTYSDVVSKLATSAGISKQVSATTITFPYLIQSCSDLQFLEDICDRTGSDWWIGGSDGKTLMFGPPAAAQPVVTLSMGDSIYDFSVRASGLHPTEVKVAGWTPTTQSTVESSPAAVAANDGTAQVGAAYAAYITSGTKLEDAKAMTVRPGAMGVPEANEIAKSLSGHAATGAITARGTVDGNGKIAPGAVIKVQGFGPASGTFRITRVEHAYTRDGFRTTFVAGDRRPTGLLDLLGPRPASAFAHQGLVTGTVDNNTDPEGYGRVKVLINGLTTSDTSAWARIATQGGGQERGFVVVPEVGDEVLIGFEDGDTRRPVVLGGLFGDKGKMAQYGVEDNKTVARGLISRLGHRMEISDGTDPATQHVRLSLEKGDAHMLRVGKDKVQITVPDSVPVEIKAGGKASIIIDDQGNITIKGQKVTIEAQQDVAIKSATAAVAVSAAAGDLKLDGLKFAVKASATGEVNGGGNLAVKGGTVMIN